MKPVFCLVAASFLAGALTVSALPWDIGNIVSPTRGFSLDGRWYFVGKPSDGNFVLREVLKDRNLDVSKIPPGIMNPGGGIFEPLSEIPAKQREEPVPFPFLLREEGDMQLASGNGFIGISFGKISRSSDQAKKALAGSGWKLTGTKNSGNPFCFATIRKGRETSIVLLEEKEGSYLSIRQLEK